MIVGETVVVTRRVQDGVDRLGEPTYVELDEVVGPETGWAAGVLVAPGPRADLPADRPNGDRIRWNLHFPKGYPASLRGALISVRGGEPLTVVGDPQHYTVENTPGEYSMPVEVVRVDG